MTIQSVLHQVNVLRDRLETLPVLTQGQLKLIREHIETCHLIIDRRVMRKEVEIERRNTK